MITYPMTDRQAKLYGWIVRYMAEHGRMPTLREIGLGLGITTPNGVAAHLVLLRKRGLVEWEDRRARSLRLVGVAWEPRFDDSPAGQAARAAYLAGQEDRPDVPSEGWEL